MDFDPNYDPSDFLPINSRNSDFGLNLPGPSYQNLTSTASIQDNLKNSDSHQELAMEDLQNTKEIKTEFDYGDLWF